jgi:hypothetical protein
MNLKLFLNKNFGRHEPFTIDQFLADANDNVDHLSPGLSRTWGFEFRSMVVDGSSTRTCSMMSTEDQALILINKQILRDCYTFLNKPIRSFYGRNSSRIGIGEDLFTRLAMGVVVH